MRIVQVGKYYPPYTGGIENNTRHCAIELAKDHDVQVLVFNQALKTVHETVEGIPVTRVASLGRVARQELAPGMVWHLRAMKPDVVHLHAPNPVAMLACVLAVPKVPVVVTHHADIVNQRAVRPFVLPLYRRVLDSAEAIILYTLGYGLTSPEVEPFRNNFEVIPHGTAAADFERTDAVASAAAALRQRLVGDAPTAFFLGRHVQYKGVAVLLEALVRVPSLHAFVGGDGPLLEFHRSLADSLGLAGRVHFLGSLRGAAKTIAFHASDFVVLPSLSRIESFGQVQVEAQLCGLPVIVSDVNSGATEVTQDKRTGFVVAPGSVGDLAGAMGRLARDVSLRQQYGQSGQRRAHSMFVETVTGPKLRRLFREVEARMADPSLRADRNEDLRAARRAS